MVRTTSLGAALVLSLVLAACGSRESEDRGQAEVQPTNGSETQSPPPETTEGERASEGEGAVVVGDDPCSTDADCMPAACCHASACVAVANAPSCGDAMCTMECRVGSIDCGGGCLCQEGRCAARLMPVPATLQEAQPQ